MGWIDPVFFRRRCFHMAKCCDLTQPEKVGQRVVGNAGLELSSQDIIDHRIAEDQGIWPKVRRRSAEPIQQQRAVPLGANAGCQMATGRKTAHRDVRRIDQPLCCPAADQAQSSSYIKQRLRKKGRKRVFSGGRARSCG